MSNKENFRQHHPDAFFLDSKEKEPLRSYLRQQGWILSGEEIVQVSDAGEGNMNYVLRIKTQDRSLVIKQARPWVEKYSDIPAPSDRILMENSFYEQIQGSPLLTNMMPKILGVDKVSRVLAMEDLGSARDCSFVYQSENLSHQHIKSLCDYLSQLHNLEISLEKKKYFQNAQMRKLNHQHMFIIPLQQNNGVDLDAITPGLQKASMDLLENSEYQELVQQLGEDYLKDGETLLHGDFYPGSWLEKDGQVKVIDPEFCFCGPAEFDVGIFLAHFFLSDQDSSLVNRFWDQYQAPVAFSQEISMRYAGVEIMRRLLGVAQLPIQHGLEKKKELLELSVVLVSCPDSYTNSGEN